MTPAAQKKVETIVKLLNADGYVRFPDWHGCEVYIIKYNKLTITGGPWFVFVYGDDVRRFTRDEGLEYLEYLRTLPGYDVSHNTAG
ncbi:MAG: hypothetical protein LUD50_01795 [Clostridia bacterium]|nr:hypothetical protein [Clostridia bacterium]